MSMGRYSITLHRFAAILNVYVIAYSMFQTLKAPVLDCITLRVTNALGRKNEEREKNEERKNINK
jgi:hypothetical protein